MDENNRNILDGHIPVEMRSIPERLNFVNEGTIRQAEWLYDHFVNHVVYGILANEWNKNS